MGRRNLSSWSDIERVAGLHGGHRHHRHTYAGSGGVVLSGIGQAQPTSPPHHHLGQLPQVWGERNN